MSPDRRMDEQPLSTLDTALKPFRHAYEDLMAMLK